MSEAELGNNEKEEPPFNRKWPPPEPDSGRGSRLWADDLI